ncbi:MAG TPA: hypothetical protein ENJ95_23120 [Bacteroidetes bacterium]|nr:hypothetical protein [Bacteroidota bacterium]
MPIITFKESGLKFEFDTGHWSALMQYDEQKDYKNLNEAIEGTKAVDFIGIWDEKKLVIIEVKNFRGHRIENLQRVIPKGHDPLAVEFAKKIRDTMPGIIGGARNSTHSKEKWKEYLKILADENYQVHAVLWLEEDPPPDSFPDRKQIIMQSTFRKNLKKGLSWLTSRVEVVNINSNPYPNTLTVNYL